MILPILLSLTLQGPREPMLVNAEWLIQHQRDPNLVLLHIGQRATYDTAHIAGAQYVAFNEFADPDTTKPALELPPVAFLDSVLEAKGVSDDSRIVIYSSNEWYSPSTRLYFTLYWAGLGNRVSLLDGGMAVFRARGGAVTSAVTTPRRGTLTLRPRSDVVVTADYVASRLNDPRTAIIDARNTGFFQGNYAGRSPQEPRPGRIPGAYNIVFADLVNDTTKLILGVPRLTELFQSARAETGDTVVAYCHIGQQGTLVWFAAKLAGYDARLYDGSFTEWSRLTQHPVERP